MMGLSVSGKIEFYPTQRMSQMKEYIDQHPAECPKLVGLDDEQLSDLIRVAERQHNIV